MKHVHSIFHCLKTNFYGVLTELLLGIEKQENVPKFKWGKREKCHASNHLPSFLHLQPLYLNCRSFFSTSHKLDHGNYFPINCWSVGTQLSLGIILIGFSYRATLIRRDKVPADSEHSNNHWICWFHFLLQKIFRLWNNRLIFFLK